MVASGTGGWTGPPLTIWSRGGMLLFGALAGVAAACGAELVDEAAGGFGASATWRRYSIL